MIEFLLLLFLVIVALAAINLKDILNCTMLLGIYSFIIAIVWVDLNAMDVAFTEAAVGSGITTILLLAVLTKVKRFEKSVHKANFLKIFEKMPLFAVITTGILLIIGTFDMPDFGDPKSPAYTYLAPDLIERAYPETGSHNIVTSVLASYRAIDTLGEATVVFTAAVCIILLLRSSAKDGQ